MTPQKSLPQKPNSVRACPQIIVANSMKVLLKQGHRMACTTKT
jgi:hypothetical protein